MFYVDSDQFTYIDNYSKILNNNLITSGCLIGIYFLRKKLKSLYLSNEYFKF